MISVTILTKNSTRYLTEVLEALSAFPEVLIYDTGSTDNTLEIAKQFKNVVIHQGPLIGFGPTHNIASNLTKYDWVLSIDSDEIVSEALAHEILKEPLDQHCVYSFPRQNFYNGKWIKWCGWHPDRQIRLYNKQQTQFTDDKVHERIMCEQMNHIKLEEPLKHYSYSSTAEFLNKMQSYSELFAAQNRGKKSSSICKAALHGAFAFLKSYFIKRGFMGGKEGFIISVYNANTAFYKYLKLME